MKNNSIDLQTKMERYCLNMENLLNYIEIENPYTNKFYNLLVDSGAQLNIIKKNQIPMGAIFSDKRILLSGITDKAMETLGVVKLPISGSLYEFHVAPNDFSIPYDGILGINILKSHKLRLDKGYVEINNQKLFLKSVKNNEKMEINLTKENESVSRLTYNQKNYFNKFLSNIIEQNQSIDSKNYIQNNNKKIYKDNIVGIMSKNKVMTNSYISYAEQAISLESSQEKNSMTSKEISVEENEIKNMLHQINFVLSDKSENDEKLDDIENYDYKKILTIIKANTEIEFDKNDDKLSYEEGFDFISYDVNNLPDNLNIEDVTDFPREEKIHNGGSINFIGNIEIQNSKKEINSHKELVMDKINISDIENTNKLDIINLVSRNEDIFWIEGDKMGSCNVEEHEINLSDEKPVYVKQFPLPYKMKDISLQETQKLIDNNLIQESKSPFNAPVWMVKKKELVKNVQRHRMVIDYRALNSVTIPDPYNLPNIQMIFDELGKNKYYHVVDLKSGFHQIKMSPKDIHKTAFSVHPLGRFEFLVLPFGLRNSPRTFQRVINNVLGGLIERICFVYMDDIIIFGKTVEVVNTRFDLVAEKLRNANMKLEPQKCSFLKTEVCYLGHIISENGIKPDPSKISAVKEFPTPKNIKNIREFLGLTNYYRKFINNFAKITKPLTILLHKNITFHWGPEQ